MPDDGAGVVAGSAAAPLDPEVAAILDILRKVGRPPYQTMAVAQAREVYAASASAVGFEAVAMAAVRDMAIPAGQGAAPGATMAIRHYRPVVAEGAALRPAILFFHGGGWVIGNLDTHDTLCRRLAAETGWDVLALDYRLAPEHPFPAAVNDALAAYAWLGRTAADLGIDTRRLALAGDSAGGGLALVVSLSASAGQGPRPCAQLLFYPVCDLRGETPSYASVTGVPMTGETMAWFRQHYLQGRADPADWRCSPLLAGNLERSPPTFLAVAGHDPLRDEDLALGQALSACAVPVVLRHATGQIHAYLTLGRHLSEAAATLEAAALFLAAHTNLHRL